MAKKSSKKEEKVESVVETTVAAEAEKKDVKEVKAETNNAKNKVEKKENKTDAKSTKSKSTKKKKSFFKEFKAELKKVSWPTFKQVVNNTGAVIAICLIIATIVFVLDVCFESLNKFGVEKLKALVTSSSTSETVEEVNVENNENGQVSNEAETPDANAQQENAETVKTDDKATETSENK